MAKKVTVKKKVVKKKTTAKKKAVKKKTTAKKKATVTIYLDKMKKELKLIEKQIDSLKLKKKVDKQLKSSYDKTIKTLHEQKKMVNKKLTEATAAWHELEKGFNGVWKQLSSSLSKAQKKFK